MAGKDSKLSEYLNKILKLAILNYIKEYKFISNNYCLNEEYNKLVQQQFPTKKNDSDDKTEHELEHSAFSNRYKNYLESNHRIFKLTSASEGHIVFFPEDVLYLYQKKLIALKYWQTIWLIDPFYICNDNDLTICLKSRYYSRKTYLESFLSRCKLIFFITQSFDNQKYLLRFHDNNKYKKFKKYLETFCSVSSDKQKRQCNSTILMTLNADISKYADEIYRNHLTIHQSDLDTLQKAIRNTP